MKIHTIFVVTFFFCSTLHAQMIPVQIALVNNKELLPIDYPTFNWMLDHSVTIAIMLGIIQNSDIKGILA